MTGPRERDIYPREKDRAVGLGAPPVLAHDTVKALADGRARVHFKAP